MKRIVICLSPKKFPTYCTCSVVYVRTIPLFSGCFTCIAIYLDSQKQSAIQRFLLFGESTIRGFTIHATANIYVRTYQDHRSVNKAYCSYSVRTYCETWFTRHWLIQNACLPGSTSCFTSSEVGTGSIDLPNIWFI